MNEHPVDNDGHRDADGQHPVERLSAYADGELPEEEALRVEAHLRGCTECARELTLIRTMGGVMRSIAADAPERSVWSAVHRRITRPVGWLLFVAGVLVLAVLALIEWVREGAFDLEWFATTAVGVGLALLVAGIGHEQYREWKTSPYKDIQ